LSEWRDELSALDERLNVEDAASGEVPSLTGEQQNQQDQQNQEGQDQEDSAGDDNNAESEDAQAAEESQPSSN